MHDIWNPWHGCQKCSEGRQNCYMYYLDRKHNNGDSSVVTKTSGFYYPLSKNRNGGYKIKMRKSTAHDVTFAFIETGNYYVKDGKTSYIKSKIRQTYLANSENLQYKGKPIDFVLTDRFGIPIPQDELYVPHYRANCLNCGNRLICNGCFDCGRCGD